MDRVKNRGNVKILKFLKGIKKNPVFDNKMIGKVWILYFSFLNSMLPIAMKMIALMVMFIGSFMWNAAVIHRMECKLYVLVIFLGMFMYMDMQVRINLRKEEIYQQK